MCECPGGKRAHVPGGGALSRSTLGGGGSGGGGRDSAGLTGEQTLGLFGPGWEVGADPIHGTALDNTCTLHT